MTARNLLVAGVSALLLASLSRAQTVYTWRDDKGVVNFADEKPDGVRNVETLTLEAPAPLVSESGGGGGGGEVGEGETNIVVPPAAGGAPQAGGAPEAKAPPSGPSEVVFLGAELGVVGDTQRSVRGRLKNIGGVPANRVSVRVVIADGDTGNLCTTSDLDASPKLLAPGESGLFEGELETPCFYGNPKIAYYPEWD